MKIKIVPDKELNQADFAVCLLGEKSDYFSDNVITNCSICDRKIHHRPYLPKELKKVCVECFNKIICNQKN